MQPDRKDMTPGRLRKALVDGPFESRSWLEVLAARLIALGVAAAVLVPAVGLLTHEPLAPTLIGLALPVPVAYVVGLAWRWRLRQTGGPGPLAK